MNTAHPPKRLMTMMIAFTIILGAHFIPLPSDLSRDAMQVIGIFAGVLVLWIRIGIDWPSLLCIAALAFVPSLGINEVLKTSFGNATFAFLLFTFMCTYALSQTGFVKRIALQFVRSPLARKSPWHLATAFLLAVLCLGLIMSPTVLFFIMLPILEEIYQVLKLEKGDKFARLLMIGLVTCTSLSSGMTPIAHVFPVLAIGVFESLTGLSISYAHYMAFAIPSGLLIFISLLLAFRFILKPELTRMAIADLQTLEISPSNRREHYIRGIFALVVLLWVLPALIASVLPELAKLINKYGTAMPPLLGVLAMAMIRIDDKALLNINEAMVKGVSWPSMIMAASTLALGAAITNEAIGLSQFIADSVQPLTAYLAPLVLILFFVSWASLQSNLSSHMVTAQLVASIAVPVALATGSISAAAIASVIGMAASIGSATPPSMPYVAIAGASGWTDAKELMKYGFLIMIISIVVLSFFAYPLAAGLMG